MSSGLQERRGQLWIVHSDKLLKDVTRQNYHRLVKTLLDMESVKNLVLQITVMIMNIPNQIIQLKAFGQNVKFAQEGFQTYSWRIAFSVNQMPS